MDEASTQARAAGKSRGRPAQALYMPPAQRNRLSSKSEVKHTIKQIEREVKEIVKILEDENCDLSIESTLKMDPHEVGNEHLHNNHTELPGTPEPESIKPSSESDVLPITNSIGAIIITDVDEPQPPQALIQVENFKTLKSPNLDKRQDQKVIIDKENKAKTKNVKAKDVKCDVLPISLAKNVKKSPIKLVQVDQWEDLFNVDDDVVECESITSTNVSTTALINTSTQDYNSDNEEENEALSDEQMEHIVELYDFPSTFKTPDIMQIYNELDQSSVYVKWLSDTKALLVLGSAIQARRALHITNPFIKSRPVAVGSAVALEAVRTCNLRPAMKRPQTSMHAARRMITTALGAKNNISREVQQREREELRKAKEQRRTQRQNERDAWEGNPRPTTA